MIDADGRRYLDFLAGIAVVGLGHLHPAPLAAAHAQLDRLWHVSNLYWTEPMAELAERLSARFGGAPGVLLQLRRRGDRGRAQVRAQGDRQAGVVALEGSFHGRTAGALSVTGQPAKRAAFEPLLPACAFARRTTSRRSTPQSATRPAASCSSRCSARAASSPSTRVRRSGPRARGRAGALLVFDEVQTGVGRTGTFFAFEQLGVRPDAVTLAKGLANGLPIGCLLVADEARSSRATTRARSAATRSSARRPSPSATRSTTSCSRTCARKSAAIRRAAARRTRARAAARRRDDDVPPTSSPSASSGDCSSAPPARARFGSPRR